MQYNGTTFDLLGANSYSHMKADLLKVLKGTGGVALEESEAMAMDANATSPSHTSNSNPNPNDNKDSQSQIITKFTKI
jgi:hypothetical protein